MTRTHASRAVSHCDPVTELTMPSASVVRELRIVPSSTLHDLGALPAPAPTADLPSPFDPQTAPEEGEALIRLLIGDNLLTLTDEASQALQIVLRALIAAEGHPVHLRLVHDGAMLSPREVAEELGVSRPFVYKLLDRGELPFEQVGRHRRVPAAAVAEFLSTQEAHMGQAEAMAVAAVAQPSSESTDVRRAALLARETGDTSALKAAMRARRTARLAQTVADAASTREQD